MFNNNDNTSIRVLTCCTIVAVFSGGVRAGDAAALALDAADTRYLVPRHEVVQLLHSNCRRNGVVWSGGVASRFSGRISPRPVRTRWQHDGDERIRCSGEDAFRQRRVSDRPFIR